MAACAFSGVGGAQMAAQGLASLFPLGDLAIIGFAAIPARLPTIVRRIRETADAVIAARPDVLVIIDSPDFTHRVARRVRARAPHIPIVDYVCPSVWAWRPGRAKRHARLHRSRAGAAAVRARGAAPARRAAGTYVGHPLLEQLGVLRPNADGGCAAAGRPAACCWCCRAAVRARSRRMAAIFGAAVGEVAKRAGPLEVVVPAVPGLAAAVRSAVAAWPVPARVVTDRAEKQAAFRQARAALTKSGTSTLELALAGVPMVAAYKVSLLEEAVARGYDQALHGDPGQSGAGRGCGAGVPAARLHGGAAGRALCCHCWPIRPSAAARPPPLPGSTASWGSDRVPPAPAPPPRSWSYAGRR